MKMNGLVAGLLGVVATANVAQAQFSASDKDAPCEQVKGKIKKEYDISQKTDLGICLKPGDKFKITNPQQDNMSFGGFIHTFNGEFDSMNGCVTPTCLSYNKKEYANHPHGAAMLLLLDAKGDVISAATLKSVVGKEQKIGTEGGHLVIDINDKKPRDNVGVGSFIMDIKRAP